MTSRPKFQTPRYLKILSLLNALYPIPVDIRDISRANNIPQHKTIAYLTNLLEEGLVSRTKGDEGRYQYIITESGRQSYRRWIIEQRLKQLKGVVENGAVR